MAFTKRELNLLILTITVIVLLLADRYVLSPAWASRQATSQMKESITTLVAENKEIIEHKGPAARRRWKQMVDNGLLDDSARSESMTLNYLNDISSKYNISLSSIQPDYGSMVDGTGTLEFTIAGSGYALDAYEFIWNIETSRLPLKLEAVHVSSKDTTSGQVSLQLKMSSIYTYQYSQQEEDSK